MNKRWNNSAAVVVYAGNGSNGLLPCKIFVPALLYPPPPPTPLKPQMKVDFVWMWIPHMGNARNLRYSRAPLRGARRGRAGISFSTWACASRRQAPRRRLPSPCRRKKALSTPCQLNCWPLLPTFLGGLGTQPNKGRTSPWQMPAGQGGAANISWSASAWRRWCCCVQGFQNSTSLLPSCGKSLFWMCMALVTSINIAGCACKCGVGALVHHRKFDRSHSDAAVLCAAALVFPSLGQDLRNNQTNAGYPEGFGMVERSSLSFCCRELICDSEVRASRACPSKPPDKNQSITCKSLRFDLRLSAE